MSELPPSPSSPWYKQRWYRKLRLGKNIPHRGWFILCALLALILATPVLVVLASLLQPFSEHFAHLRRTVLNDYIQNSLMLMLGVGCGVILVGVSTAWFVVMCRFPGRKILQWMLLLPLAIPAYILAYMYTDFLQFSGPLQSWLREIFHWTRHDYIFPEIRSRGGAMLILTLSLYPYVYLLTRAAFLEQSSSLLEASRSLGLNAWRSFWKISLPLARPSIVAGTSLALMETLSDFGTVDYFGISTFTTGIYRAWFGTGEHITAAQLASFLLLVVLVLLLLEQASRRRSRHQKQPSQSRYRNLTAYRLTGLRAYAVSLWCFLPIFMGFILPSCLLQYMTLRHIPWLQNFSLTTVSWSALTDSVRNYSWQYAQHSFILALSSTLLAIIIALFIAYAVRLNPHMLSHLLSRIASLGYAVPGSVIGVGVLLSFGYLQQASHALGFSHIVIIGSIGGLIFAYLARFLAVALGGIQASLNKITANIDEAARGLGYRTPAILWRIHTPLLRHSLLTAGLLVFVDVMKELPATLIIRPFNFDTLAVRIYRLASDERLSEAAGDALIIVLVGIIPVLLLSASMLKQER